MKNLDSFSINKKYYRKDCVYNAIGRSLECLQLYQRIGMDLGIISSGKAVKIPSFKAHFTTFAHKMILKMENIEDNFKE